MYNTLTNIYYIDHAVSNIASMTMERRISTGSKQTEAANEKGVQLFVYQL